MEHQDQREILPEPSKRLRKGDEVLFCGRQEARNLLDRTLQDLHQLRSLAPVRMSRRLGSGAGRSACVSPGASAGMRTWPDESVQRLFPW